MNEEMFRMMIVILFLAVLVLLSVMLYTGLYGMARIYNWNGKRYCYLGYVPIRRENGGFAVRIGEHMVDLSRTTAYRICPSRVFCKRNRYRELFVYADRSRSYLVVDTEPMKTEVPF